MKNVIRFLTLLLTIALAITVYLSLQLTDDDGEEIDTETIVSSSDIEKGNEMYETIMAVNLSENYPTSYLGVMEYYNDIVSFLYSGYATEEQIINVIEIERRLYSREILLENTYEEQIAYALEDINTFTQNGNRILNYEILDIFETNLSNNMVEIRVLYRVTKTGNIDMLYYLVKEDGLWKIMSFKASTDGM